MNIELAPGTALLGGRFIVGRVLGRGGSGITYEADDSRLHRTVAVKELFPESAIRRGATVVPPIADRENFDRAKERFVREAQVLARFNHPGIVRVYEVFEEHGTAYLVLEFLQGRTLAEVLRSGGAPLSESACLDIAGRVGGALSVIHEAGLLHRDLSPSNMVVAGSSRIVLIDFGLARSYDAGHTASMTRMVTPGYAPPEQYLTAARFGPPTDVYGLAASLYRLLTAASMPSAIDRQHGAELAPPCRLNPAVSKLVSDAVLDGLELDPQHRPQSVDAFLRRLGVPASSASSPSPLTERDRTVIELAPSSAADRLTRVADNERPATGTAVDHVVVPAPANAPTTAAVAPLVQPVESARWAYPPTGANLDAYLPGPVVGPPRQGRWVVSVPLTLAAAGLMSADPVLLSACLVLLVLPLCATYGDLRVHEQRRAWGGAQTWFQRRSARAAAVPVALRNLVWSIVRAVPALALLSVLVAGWYPLHDSGRLVVAGDWLLRVSGVAVGLLLVTPPMRGGRRLSIGIAVDALHDRIAPEGSRVNRAGAVTWLVCIGVAAIGFAFTPDVWPLAG